MVGVVGEYADYLTTTTADYTMEVTFGQISGMSGVRKTSRRLLPTKTASKGIFSSDWNI